MEHGVPPGEGLPPRRVEASPQRSMPPPPRGARGSPGTRPPPRSMELPSEKASLEGSSGTCSPPPQREDGRQCARKQPRGLWWEGDGGEWG